MTERDLSARSALQAATDILSHFDFDTPELEARFLLSGLLKVPLTDFFVNPDRLLMEEEIQTFQAMVERRCKHEPVSYIVGWHNFMGFDLQVDPRVLIPRPETEILVEEAAEWITLNQLKNPKIMDLCAGSGCVSIGMARKFPDASVLAVDVCEKALSLAKNNAKSLGNVALLASDLFAKLDPAKDGDFDMIAANPPYISTSEMRELEIDVTFEPVLALDGGKDGLKVMSKLVKDAPRFLKKNGLLIVEIGTKQGLAVERLFANAGFEKIEVIKDFQGHDRIVKGEKCGSV